MACKAIGELSRRHNLLAAARNYGYDRRCMRLHVPAMRANGEASLDRPGRQDIRSAADSIPVDRQTKQHNSLLVSGRQWTYGAVMGAVIGARVS